MAMALTSSAAVPETLVRSPVPKGTCIQVVSTQLPMGHFPMLPAELEASFTLALLARRSGVSYI